MKTSFKRLLPLVLLLTLPAVVRAQFQFVTNNGAITITRYTGVGGAVTIPSMTNGLLVTGIGDYAFSYNSSLTSVMIPNIVTNIGDRAFWYCTSLTAITVDALNSVYSSMDGVLFNKSQTTLITYPTGKAGAYTIPNSVTSIEGYTFANCTGLTSMAIPNSVTNIGSSAFESCTSLTNVTIGTNVTSIGDAAFYWCTSLISVTIPNSVTSIGGGAFWYCTSLVNVTIGTNVTSIGHDAFSTCTDLTSITIPNSVTSSGSSAFESCSSLTTLAIGTNLTSIGDWTFYGCTSLNSATIPNSVTNIGYAAFESCSSLTNVAIGNGVTTIGQYALSGCTSLMAIMVDTLNSVYSSVAGALLNKSQTTLIQCPAGKAGTYAIPDSVTIIGDYAFSGCHRLTSVTVPNSVTNIGLEAFASCTGLTSITIPNSVANIGDSAFYNCASLTSVSIPNSVTSIGDAAFSWCTSLTSVMIPSSATNIGGWAFVGCTSLTAITVDPLHSVYSSLDGILFNKSLTTLIQCPAGKAGTYTIPTSVTTIGDAAFFACSGLTSVTIPSSVTNIGQEALEGCTSLTSVSIPNSVTSIGDAAFYLCTSLTRVTIPNSVTGIGGGAFNYCSSLASIVIPNSVSTIGMYAFANCTSLTEVYFQGNAPSIGSDVFDYDDNTTVYYLPGTAGWGTTYGGRPTVLYLPPVADAGATAARLVSGNGANATALLNGSRSYGPDGDALQYLWVSYPGSQPPTLLATGVVAVIVLPVGSHPILLVVSDGMLSVTNAITVEVITTAQAVERLIAHVKSTWPHPRPLVATLEAALASIERGHPLVATVELLAFQCQVRAQVRPRDPALAATFIKAAQEVMDALRTGAGHPGHPPHGRFSSLSRLHNGRVHMQFPADPGQVCILEASTNLVDWEMIGVAVDDGDGMFTFEDANAARFPNRFYRLKLLYP